MLELPEPTEIWDEEAVFRHLEDARRQLLRKNAKITAGKQDNIITIEVTGVGE